MRLIPLPVLLGVEEVRRGGYQLVTAAAGSISLGAAAAQTTMLVLQERC